MIPNLYRYLFEATVPAKEIEATLVLSIIAVEALHGEARARLEVSHFYDPDKRACVIDASTVVGQDFARLFTGLMTREFGLDAFQVEHLRDGSRLQAAPADATP